MKFHRIPLVATVAAAALLLGACGGNADSDNATGNQKVITVDGTEPQNPLIPTNTNEVGGGKVVDLIFEGLFFYDAKGKLQNGVAESIDTKDGQNYTVKLKKDRKFTNGDPVTAKSFVDAWNFGAAKENNQLSGWFFEPIKGYGDDGAQPLNGLKVVDDYTFTVELKQPEADFPLRLGYSAFFPLPAVAFEDIKAFGENPVGNGPYKVEKWEHGVSIKLAVNKDYDGGRKAKNGGVDIKIYNKQDAAYNDLLSNKLDVLTAIPDSAFKTYEKELDGRSINQPAAIFQSFTIAKGTPGFEVGTEEGTLRRQALSMALDRKLVIDAVFDGTRTPASDFTSPVIDGWSDKLKGADVLKHNPKKAKELWEKANKIKPFAGKFTIAYNVDGGHQAWVDAVCNQFKNTLGIEAEGKPYAQFSELRTEVTDRTMKGGFRTGWQADYPSLQNFLGPLYRTGAGANDSDYSNADFDALLTKGNGAKNVAEANKYYQSAQEVLLKELPVFPLWYSNANGGYAEGVKNVEFGWNSAPLLYNVTKK